MSEKPFYLYKGDDAVFDGINKIEISITSSTTDLTRFSGMFQLGEFKQIGSLTNGFMKIELTRDYTRNFLFGPIKGAFRLLDGKGHIKTITNNLNFYVTDDISLLEQNGPIVLPDITIDGDQFHLEVQIDVPLTQYGDLEGKPRINDVEINGNKTGDYYGLQQKLTAGDHISLVNDTIGVIVDNELSDESTHPVENQVVKAALDANSSAIDNHITNKNNPHEVTKAQVGLGNVDNTADLDKPISTATQTALNGKQANLTQVQLDAVNSGATSAKIAAIAQNTQAIGGINEKIPNQASAENQLADKNFVNSSIATNTANFIGTFNSVAELEAYSGTLTNNDYAFVVGVDSDGNTVYNRYKYTTTTNPASWQFEYALNNSSFTATQWEAINSGITATLAAQITTNANNITSLQTNKLDKTEAANTYLTQSDASSTYLTQANAATTYLTQSSASSTYATKTELTTGLAAKQDTINDLATIRSGASAGATALQASDVDNALSPTSENPVQNKVIYAAIGDVETLLNNLNSGDYNE